MPRLIQFHDQIPVEIDIFSGKLTPESSKKTNHFLRLNPGSILHSLLRCWQIVPLRHSAQRGIEHLFPLSVAWRRGSVCVFQPCSLHKFRVRILMETTLFRFFFIFFPPKSSKECPKQSDWFKYNISSVVRFFRCGAELQSQQSPKCAKEESLQCGRQILTLECGSFFRNRVQQPRFQLTTNMQHQS